MDDGLLVRVLDAVAHLDEELEPLLGVQGVAIAVVRDRNPGHVLHDEVRPALGCASRVEHLGDGGVIHERECLALGLETSHHLLGVHARLDDLDRHPAPDRFELLGQPDLAHAALADDLEKPVRPDTSGPVSLTVGADGVLHGNGVVETCRRPVLIAGHTFSQTPSGGRSQR